MVFRPSLKRVQSQTTYVERPQGLKIIPKPNRLSSARPEGKKSYFPYRIERAEKEKKLLKEMKTLTAIKNASAETLSAIKGISKNDGEAVFRYFHAEQ